MNIPSNPTSSGTRLSGKVSWFGGPGDRTDSGHTASGGTTRQPGIAIYNRSTLGGYWRVRANNGRTAILKQTDLGPAPFTGRKIDVTYSALGKFGYHQGNFPTDATFSAEYLGRKPPKGGIAAAEARSPTPSLPGVSKPSGQTFDQAGFQKAQKGAILGKLIKEGGGAKDNPLFATGLVSTRLPQRSEYENLPAPKGQLLKTPGASVYVPPTADTTKLKGVAHFGDKQVAMWIAPILKYAKEHGWRGSVTSGFRSNAEQTRIYNSGVRPAARPGTSNHEGTDFPRGAVDVTDADALAKILARSPYRGRLVWAGSKDPVHFSHPHGGSY